MVIFNEVSVEKKDLRDQSVTATAQFEWHEECGDTGVSWMPLMGLDSLKKG